ncbi:hydrogenase maturation protease [Microbulbifer salipaludis]|uniref:Hydrogenase maturation protease n=1 Tax=Microbulbifer salipaludis TaxID=187980 RepID=A0ABS3E8G9_9GAMM|nr:hydrogenase maturation protease [Microbulbifer salipaludis]MBN8431615.1 hydrogenase maturation protease [Microbulbifer salipaludis]
MSGWTIIGVGNRFRGDDSVGPYVIDRLRSRLPSSTPCIENNGDMTSLLDEWRQRRVCLIDALQAEDQATGAILRLNGLAEEIPPTLCRTSSHGLNLGEALALAGALDALPERLDLYAICGEDFSPNASLSAAVEDAARQVEREILEKLSLHTGGV